jgi:hypothetical protein
MKSASRERLTSVSVVLVLLALPAASFAADEGAAPFKSKCALSKTSGKGVSGI